MKKEKIVKTITRSLLPIILVINISVDGKPVFFNAGVDILSARVNLNILRAYFGQYQSPAYKKEQTHTLIGEAGMPGYLQDKANREDNLPDIGNAALDAIAEDILADAAKAVSGQRVSLASRISKEFINEVIQRLEKKHRLQEAKEFKEIMQKVSGFFMYDAYNDQFVRIHTRDYVKFLQLAKIAGFKKKDLNFEAFAEAELSVAVALQKTYTPTPGSAFFNRAHGCLFRWQEELTGLWRLPVSGKNKEISIIPLVYTAIARARAAEMIKHEPLIFGTEIIGRINMLANAHDIYNILKEKNLTYFMAKAGFFGFHLTKKISIYEYVPALSVGRLKDNLPFCGKCRDTAPAGGFREKTMFREFVFIKKIPRKGDCILFEREKYLVISDTGEGSGLIETIKLMEDSRLGNLENVDKIKLLDPEDARIRVVLPDEDERYEFKVGEKVLLHDVRFKSPVPATIVNAGFGMQMYLVAYEPVDPGAPYLGRGIKINIDDIKNKGILEKLGEENNRYFPMEPSCRCCYFASGNDAEVIFNILRIFPHIKEFWFVDPFYKGDFKQAVFIYLSRALKENGFKTKQALLGMEDELLKENKTMVIPFSDEKGMERKLIVCALSYEKFQDIYDINFDIGVIAYAGDGGNLGLQKDFWEAVSSVVQEGGYVIVRSLRRFIDVKQFGLEKMPDDLLDYINALGVSREFSAIFRKKREFSKERKKTCVKEYLPVIEVIEVGV